MELKHGDKQQTFGTGAKRDEETGKPQFSLISPYMLTRLAEWLTKAVPHYGKDNWAKGLPLRRTWDSLMRHLIAVWEGKHDEDHEAALLCNVMFFIDTKHRVQEGQLPAVLDDMPTYCKEK
ncbi:MAG: hypothetical protein IMZ50_12645, partial [Candidatus Atribacteria bacterium]|nr:hypothetical protein [Candidatus Atribacteria bacterium]